MDPETATATQETTLDPERWVDEHGDALFRFAILRLRDRDLAEDVVQETFIAALRGAESYQGRASERTWLIGILKRKVIDHFRKRYREQPASQLGGDDTDTEALFETLFSKGGHWRTGQQAWAGDPQSDLERKEFQEALKGCLGKLPGRQGEAFVMREIEQMDTEEICQVLNITPTNLWAMLHRGRMRLRECLGRNWFGRE